MTSHFEHITKLLLTVMLLCGVSLALAQTGAARITTASGVRLRIAPQTSADEVTRLPLGEGKYLELYPQGAHAAEDFSLTTELSDCQVKRQV